ncbi:hypothetical protein L7F22_004186 [Adiantum nelumboides]|nr:hypothetical protein [Adiantum nelumboides]
MGRVKRPEWQYVDQVKACKKGQWTCKCKFCGHTWDGGPARIRYHLLKIAGHGVGPCDQVPDAVKEVVTRLHADARGDGTVRNDYVNELVNATGEEASQSVNDATAITHASDSSKSKKRKGYEANLGSAFHLQARKHADQALRRFFYAEDIPEWKVRSPFFLEMVKAIGQAGPSYVPPSHHALRTTHLNDEDTPKRDDIVYLVKKRWEWRKRPIHGFAALLHSAYKKPSFFSDQVLNKERMKYLPKVLKEELHGEFLQEVINYGDQRGTAFASSVCWKRDSLVKPLFWWESFSFQMPHIQRVTLRVLGQDCSSGACEQNWFAYSLIHTKIRNKLSTTQLERLIYCRSNLRMLRSMHEMPMARQVNVDECKLSVETLKSINKDHDLEEEQIFRELYMELEEIDRRVSRTQSRKKVVVQGSATGGRGSSTSAVRGGGRASTRAPTTYVRRGSGSGSSTMATTLENVPLFRSTKPREPEFDDEGDILSERDYGLSSTHSDTSNDEDDTHHDSDWETDTST